MQFNGFSLFPWDLICVINYFGAGCRFVFKESFIFKIQIREHKKKSSQINCLSLFYLRVISMLLGNLKLKKETPFINFRRFPSNHNKHPYSKLLHDSQKIRKFFSYLLNILIRWSVVCASTRWFTWTYRACLKTKENRYRPIKRFFITPARQGQHSHLISICFLMYQRPELLRSTPCRSPNKKTAGA